MVIVGVRVDVRVIVGVQVGGRTTEVGRSVASTGISGGASSVLTVGAVEPQAMRRKLRKQISVSSVWDLVMCNILTSDQIRYEKPKIRWTFGQAAHEIGIPLRPERDIDSYWITFLSQLDLKV
jgi:hypothetical protein